MYSYEGRIRAVEFYIKLRKRVRPTIRQLGYTQYKDRVRSLVPLPKRKQS